MAMRSVITLLMNRAAARRLRTEYIAKTVLASWAITAALLGAAVAYQYLDGLLWTLQ